MKKKDFLDNLAKIFEKNKISEKDSLKSLEFDSLIALDIATFNDINFKNLTISYEEVERCKTIKDLMKLYGNSLNIEI